jgi:MFS family permease
VSLDYKGATLIAGGLSCLLLWVSLAGSSFDWISPTSAGLVAGGIALLLVSLRVERKAKDPLIPLRLLRNRTVVLATAASASVGVALFASTVFLTQYMQLARGKTPTESGLLTIPLVLGLFVASTLAGRFVSRTGRYKRLMVRGALLLTAGMALMGTMDETTPLVELMAFMLLMGTGLGCLMQNLVLVVQNTVAREDIGSASALVTFMRTLGGAAGVSILGAVLSAHAGHGLAGADPHAIGTGVGVLFLVAAPLGLVVAICLALIREHPLGQQSGIEIARAEAAGA